MIEPLSHHSAKLISAASICSSILSVVRRLVVNAIIHAKATRVVVEISQTEAKDHIHPCPVELNSKPRMVTNIMVQDNGLGWWAGEEEKDLEEEWRDTWPDSCSLKMIAAVARTLLISTHGHFGPQRTWTIIEDASASIPSRASASCHPIPSVPRTGSMIYVEALFDRLPVRSRMLCLPKEMERLSLDLEQLAILTPSLKLSVKWNHKIILDCQSADTLQSQKAFSYFQKFGISSMVALTVIEEMSNSFVRVRGFMKIERDNAIPSHIIAPLLFKSEYLELECTTILISLLKNATGRNRGEIALVLLCWPSEKSINTGLDLNSNLVAHEICNLLLPTLLPNRSCSQPSMKRIEAPEFSYERSLTDAQKLFIAANTDGSAHCKRSRPITVAPIIPTYSSKVFCLPLSKSDLKNIQVIGQFGLKFVACLLMDSKRLCFFDQHACDERIRLEMEFNYPRHVFLSPDQIVRISLRDVHVSSLRVLSPILRKWGFQFLQVEEFKIHLMGIPEVLVTFTSSKLCDIFLRILEDEFIDAAEFGSQWKCPKLLYRLYCSKACRLAIKFGDSLSLSESCKLMLQLSECHFPFQCAHGRPTFYSHQ